MELICIQEINFILTTRKKNPFIGNLKTAKRYKCLHESPGKKYKNSSGNFTGGRRSGIGRSVTEFFDDLVPIWGGASVFWNFINREKQFN